MNCVYCESPEIKLRIVTSNKYAFAFLTNIPIVPGHTLVVPIRHVAKFDDLNEEERGALFALRTVVAGALSKTFGAQGFNYAWNEDAVAGQSIPHFHLHVVPRKEGDTGITEYEPRKFLYRPGSRAETPEAELQEVTSLIRKNLATNR